jgi:hypothetical protein
MTRTLRLATLVVLLCVVMPGAAMAHGGGEPWIHVPTQSIEPGQPFELWGSDLGPGASVSIAVTADDRSIAVGTVTADAEGHFTQTLTLPAGVPEGYRQLRADSDAGVDAFMWVLVGQDTTGAVNPAAAGGSEWWSDPSVLVLGAMLAAAMVAVIVLALRSRRPAAVRATAAQPRPLPRKGSRRQRRGSG